MNVDGVDAAAGAVDDFVGEVLEVTKVLLLLTTMLRSTVGKCHSLFVCSRGYKCPR